MEPHSRPSGRVAQLGIRVGFGFGSPSPVIGLTAAVAIAGGGSDSATHPARIAAPKSTDNKSLNDDIVPPTQISISPRHGRGHRNSGTFAVSAWRANHAPARWRDRRVTPRPAVLFQYSIDPSSGLSTVMAEDSSQTFLSNDRRLQHPSTRQVQNAPRRPRTTP